MDDLSLSDITPECPEARGWRRNEGLMDGDDGVSKKSRTQGQRKTTWTPQNKTVNLFFFFFKIIQ